MLDFSRFKRPRKLSDPGRDFDREDLEAILATDDRAMGFYEFACLFGEWLPAGTYAVRRPCLVVFPILTCVMQFGIIYAVDEKVRFM